MNKFASRNIYFSVIFTIFVVFIRLPLFNRYMISTDEHTFLNIGHDVFKGHLPYMHLWDVKPPLLFMLMAPISALAGHHFWVVRLIAAVCDTVTSLIAKGIADRLYGERAAHWVCAVWCAVGLSMTPVGGALMSETLSLPFLMGAAYVLATDRLSPRAGFLAGLMLGAATLIRQLPAFPALAVELALLAEAAVRRDPARLRVAVATGLGGGVVLVAVTLPYLAVPGGFDMLYRTLVPAALGYAGGSSGATLLSMLLNCSRLLTVTLVVGVLGAIVGVLSNRRAAGGFRPQDVRLLVMFAATLVAISVGQAWAYYLALPMAFAAVGAAPLLQRLTDLAPPRAAPAILAGVAVILTVIAGRTILERSQQPDPMAQTYAILRHRMGPGDTLYATTDYALYWLLDRDPPHPIVTHAGCLFKPYVFRQLAFHLDTSEAVMRVIVARRPTYIVFDDEDGPRYAAGTAVGRILQPVVRADYERLPSPEHRMIFRLKAAAHPDRIGTL